jgi:hypothetical protein
MMNSESLQSTCKSAVTPARVKQVSKLQELHAPYFVQQVQVGSELANRPRIEVFRQLCAGRRVLHVGCVDWPITDIGNSLHVALDAICAQLDGFDVHAEAFTSLRPHVRGHLFSDWKDVTGVYDIVLVPEVLEHVGDVAAFLGQLDCLHAPHVILTVPDAYSCARRHFDYNQEQEVFIEVVHPDHNCWYTPYTLVSVLSKYTDWKLDGMWFFNGISLLAILTKSGSAK